MCLKSNCDTNHFLFFSWICSCDMAFLNRFQDYLMKYILHNKFVIMIYSVVVYDGVTIGSPCCWLCWDGNADLKAHPLETNKCFHPETNKICRHCCIALYCTNNIVCTSFCDNDDHSYELLRIQSRYWSTLVYTPERKTHLAKENSESILKLMVKKSTLQKKNFKRIL